MRYRFFRGRGAVAGGLDRFGQQNGHA
jgi:hypothetical protein